MIERSGKPERLGKREKLNDQETVEWGKVL